MVRDERAREISPSACSDCTQSYLSDVIELMVAGSGPDSVPQPLTSRYCRAVSALMSDGMLPLKWLPASHRPVNDVNVVRTVGKVPDNQLEFNIRDLHVQIGHSRRHHRACQHPRVSMQMPMRRQEHTAVQ